MRAPTLGRLAALAIVLATAACGDGATDTRVPGVTVSVASAAGRWVITPASAHAAGLLALSFDLAESSGTITGRGALSGVELAATGAQHGEHVSIALSRDGDAAFAFDGVIAADGTLRGTLTGPAITATPVVFERAP